MTIFLDTANIIEIKKYLNWGCINGITTNQKIFLQEKGVDYKTRLREILELVKGPVSIELTKTAPHLPDSVLLEEALKLNTLGSNVVVKIPMWGNGRGLRIAHELLKNNIKINMTCCISVNQAILACELDANYVSFFYNRMIDYYKQLGLDKYVESSKKIVQKQIENTRKIIDSQLYETEIICGSIRRPEDVSSCFTAGTHIVTITPKVLEQLPFHPKTEETIKEFDEAWKMFIGEESYGI